MQRITNDFLNFSVRAKGMQYREGFHSIWPTRVELCACTSDRERSTRTSEVSTSRKPKPGHVIVLVLVSRPV